MDAQPDDAAILAAVDTEPEAFALFYRRHVAGLLGYLVRRTHDVELAADLCAETFAAALDGAHRFEPARRPPVAWLYGIARRLFAHAERRGAVEDRARRRLGMAPLDLTDAALERLEALAGSEAALAALAELPDDQRAAVQARVVEERDYAEIALAAHASESVIRKRVSRGLAGMRTRLGDRVMSDDFVRDLEEELVAAARFRAARRRRRFAVPRRRVAPRPLAAALAIGATAALAIAAVVGFSRDGDPRIADEPPAPVVAFALPDMAPPPSCDAEPALDREAADGLPPMAIFDRTQGEPDGMPVGPDVMPVAGFVPHESRRPGLGKLKTELTLVPARGVRPDGACPHGGDVTPGLCILAGLSQPPRVRCFTTPDVAAGRAAAQLGPALVVGAVPDGVTHVTLTSRERSVTAAVVENAYEAVLPGVAPGARIEVALRGGDDGCRRVVAPELLDRVPALRARPQPGQVLPGAALGVVRDWGAQIDALVEDGARFWGGGDGVEFWVVPAVPHGAKECAPATRVCVIALPEQSEPDGACLLEGPTRDGAWRLAPLLPGNAAIYGLVPDGVTRVRVTIGGVSGEVDARDNVVGGVLPFPYRDEGKSRVELFRTP